MKKFGLELIVFVCGTATMSLELVGSRILAPYVGTSLIVWTSLIGVILGCLSLGYWWGGVLADRHPNYKLLSFILLISSAFVGIISFSGDVLLTVTADRIPDLRIASTLSAVILFGIPSVLLGMVVPFAVRLKITDLNKTGKTAGSLYAISTFGSILGTFLTGFVFTAYFSTSKILFFISLALVACSLLCFQSAFIKIRMGIFFLLLVSLLCTENLEAMIKGTDLVDVNTPYSRVWIYDEPFGSEAPVTIRRVMRINREFSSAIYLNKEGFAFGYFDFFNLVKHFKPEAKKALLIGGGAYVYPQAFLNDFPEARMDVVELDPKLIDLAKKYFYIKANPRLSIIHEDARTYLNRNREKYDVIFTDAFQSYTIPFQLISLEAFQKMHRSLNEGGYLIMNLISPLEGKSKLLRAVYRTVKNVFPYVYIFRVSNVDTTVRQNLILIAARTGEPPVLENDDPELNRMLGDQWLKPIPGDLPVLTDDFAPIETYAFAVQPSIKVGSPIKYHLRKILVRFGLLKPPLVKKKN